MSAKDVHVHSGLLGGLYEPLQRGLKIGWQHATVPVNPQDRAHPVGVATDHVSNGLEILGDALAFRRHLAFLLGDAFVRNDGRLQHVGQLSLAFGRRACHRHLHRFPHHLGGNGVHFLRRERVVSVWVKVGGDFALLSGPHDKLFIQRMVFYLLTLCFLLFSIFGI